MRTSMLSRVGGACVVIFIIIFVPFVSHGKIGVGMGAGEIRLTDDVRPGSIYTLPNVRVFNTGDEITTYKMGVAYHQDHPELRPSKEWFSFTPETFTIEPTKSQVVEVRMLIPIKATPGEYFAFIESGPVPDNSPGTSVGVAVATKLYFTIVPANVFSALQYRTAALFEAYSPGSWIIIGLMGLVALILLMRKFFSFSISMRK